MYCMKAVQIGSARIAEGEVTQEHGVTFRIPYSPQPYDITLNDEDLDTLLREGFSKMIGGFTLRFECEIPLPGSDLSLFAGAESMTVTPHGIHMEANIVTKSFVNEHRGILSTYRHGKEPWELLDYTASPPLGHLPQAP